MLILAFDTTVAACSVALCRIEGRDGTVLAHARETMDQGQAEALIPLFESVMRTAGVDYATLDRIAVTVGPGSFTGVRVGLSAARGLGLATGKPVIGILTTEALAHAVPEKPHQILAAVDTKRGDLYVQQFDAQRQPLGDPRALAPDQLKAWLGETAVIVVGDAAALAIAALGPHATLSTADALPDPAIIATLAATRTPSASGPLPVYVRPPDAVIPQNGGRLRI